MARLAPDDFRRGRFYNEDVDALLKRHAPLLKALYSRYRLRPAAGGLRPKLMRLDGWLAFVGDARLVDAQLTLADAQLAFLWARMGVADEVRDYTR